MIRILEVVNDMHRAGLETMLMNYYRNIDRDQIQFDFLTHRPYDSDYDQEIRSLGGKIYHAPRLYPQNYPAYFKYMKIFFKNHPEYKIVHSHVDAMSYLPLKAAKKAGVPIRIAHSHNTSIDKDFKYPLKVYFKHQIPKVANYYAACGQAAGEFLFPGKDFKFIPNAIEPNKFLFNEQIRKEYRVKLGFTDKNFVIGHVGRLSYQKNHRFLIKIFDEVHKREPNARLILVGVGEKEKVIRKQVNELHLNKYVQFLGNRSDVANLYQAFDVFVMPSLFEGIPVVGIEAQFSGLPIIFSDKVPKEVKFTSMCKFISLKSGLNEWMNPILKFKNISRQAMTAKNVDNSIYNIKYSHVVLENYYLTLLKDITK